MKIAIPTDDRENTAAHFGRAAEFAVFTAEEGKVSEPEFRANVHTHGEEHGGEHKQGQGKSHEFHGPLSDIDVIICGGMGKNAQQAIEELSIKVFFCSSAPLKELAAACANDTLKQGKPSCGCSH